jgi:pyruvate,water dikinase
MNAVPLCVPLSSLSASDVVVAGGKGANLGELIRGGFDVPDGFVVTTHAYRSASDGADAPPSTQQVLDRPVPADIAEAIGAAYRELGAGRVAVRSSATTEDLPGAAFAGQHDTFLDVVGAAEVVVAVRRCWASLWTERAVAYRGRVGVDPSTVAIAVVVQQMVRAEFAGVVFTANPVTGNRAQVVIDSAPGLGDALVSGLVTPDHAVLDSANRVVERLAGRPQTPTAPGDAHGTDHEPARHVPALRREDLARIAAVGRRVALHFGRPQDIEWATHERQLWVVQARPMTALPPAPIRLGRARRMIGATLLELLPRRPYPMEVSAWAQPSIGTHVERMVMGLAGVRVRFGGVIPAVDGVVQSFVPPVPRPTWRTVGRLWRSARTARRIQADAWRTDPRYVRYLAAAGSLDTTAPGDQRWDDLIATPAEVADLVDIVTRLRVDYLPSAAAALIKLQLLLRLLGRSDLFRALVVTAPTVTTGADQAIERMAELVADDPGVAAAFSRGLDHAVDFVTNAPEAEGFRTQLGAFLSTYGHRETSSLLLVRDPTWGEAPATVLALVMVLLDRPVTSREPSDAPDATRSLTSHWLIVLTRSERRVERLLRRAAAGVALREDTHFELTRLMPTVRRAVVEMGRRLQRGGLLDRGEDVWMLTMEDLAGLGEPFADRDAADLRALVRRRGSAYAELAASPLIATTTLYPPRSTRSAADLVTGVGGGGGRVTGTVRVITGPDQFSTLRPGEVLVCAATNPSWTPLFQRAAAVVVDHGGLASHAAIVAREYGVPAVMGTGVGTGVLSTGQLVEVNGDTGTVREAEDHGR